MVFTDFFFTVYTFRILPVPIKMLPYLINPTVLSQAGHHLRHGLDFMGFLRSHKLIWLKSSHYIKKKRSVERNVTVSPKLTPHRFKNYGCDLNRTILDCFLFSVGNNPSLPVSSGVPESDFMSLRSCSRFSRLMQSPRLGRECSLAACTSSWVPTSRFVSLQNPNVVLGCSV